MPEWLKNLLIAIGGGSVVLAGAMTIFKSLFLKFFETGIESSFEKKLEKYRNELMRSTKAYEMLLLHELKFYEKVEIILSEMTTSVQDMGYYLENNDFVSHDVVYKVYVDRLRNYVDHYRSLKNTMITYQPYITSPLCTAITEFGIQTQDDLTFWLEIKNILSDGNCGEADYAKAEKIINDFITMITEIGIIIRDRLTKLSQLKE